MKVYSDMKGPYILIRNPSFEAGTEFMVIEKDNEISLVKVPLKEED